MTELVINFGHGEVHFRDETWGGMVALLCQMLDCLQPSGAIACRLEELVEPPDWLDAYNAAQEKIARLNEEE